MFRDPSSTPEATLIHRSILAIVVLALGASVALAQADGNAQRSQQDPDSLVGEGETYLRRGDCALAQYFFQEALAQDPEHEEALIGRGQALRCQGSLPAAVESLRSAVEIGGENADALVQLALTYREQYLSDEASYPSRLSDAYDAVQRAESLEPDDPTVLNTKGIIQFHQGDLDQARQTLERAVAEAAGEDLDAAEHSTIHLNLGRVYRDLGQLEQARQSFRRAVIADPTNADAHNLLGNVHFRLDDCEQAEYELAQAAALAPDSLSPVSQLGITLFECGQVEDSVEYFERALELDGAVFTPPLYTYLARAYLEQGRLDDAVRRAQQGALLPPERAEAHYVLGRAYEARGGEGDMNAAQEAYEQALELNPNYDQAESALQALQ